MTKDEIKNSVYCLKSNQYILRKKMEFNLEKVKKSQSIATIFYLQSFFLNNQMGVEFCNTLILQTLKLIVCLKDIIEFTKLQESKLNDIIDNDFDSILYENFMQQLENHLPYYEEMFETFNR